MPHQMLKELNPDCQMPNRLLNSLTTVIRLKLWVQLRLLWIAISGNAVREFAAGCCLHVQLQKCRNWGNEVSRFLFKCADIFSSDYRRNICSILLPTFVFPRVMRPPPERLRSFFPSPHRRCVIYCCCWRVCININVHTLRVRLRFDGVVTKRAGG